VFNGGAPGNWSAQGFLKFATNGTLGWPFVIGTPDPKAIYNPTHSFWVSLAGNDTAMTIVNNLVVGEMCIGIALIFGIVTRFAGAMGALMMALLFLAPSSQVVCWRPVARLRLSVKGPAQDVNRRAHPGSPTAMG
jgi:uncharacterized membrane protein YphA (DoxX/SURF4 family)